MNPSWIESFAASKFAALSISLFFNVVMTGAVWRLWKSREALQDKVTTMLMELLNEVNRRYWNEQKK